MRFSREGNWGLDSASNLSKLLRTLKLKVWSLKPGIWFQNSCSLNAVLHIALIFFCGLKSIRTGFLTGMLQALCHLSLLTVISQPISAYCLVFWMLPVVGLLSAPSACYDIHLDKLPWWLLIFLTGRTSHTAHSISISILISKPMYHHHIVVLCYQIPSRFWGSSVFKGIALTYSLTSFAPKAQFLPQDPAFETACNIWNN